MCSIATSRHASKVCEPRLLGTILTGQAARACCGSYNTDVNSFETSDEAGCVLSFDRGTPYRTSYTSQMLAPFLTSGPRGLGSAHNGNSKRGGCGRVRMMLDGCAGCVSIRMLDALEARVFECLNAWMLEFESVCMLMRTRGSGELHWI